MVSNSYDKRSAVLFHRDDIVRKSFKHNAFYTHYS